ncbi:hypothetical protein JNB_05035 [Janibacter sp. HTCC2649]|uniref:DUF4870 domain-containing protein n=1 Tax=Janibacter sp. HTCC2649 TaxID=313589 RepID=UPI000066EBD6|nr:DUF4870 domain-containing protein [Janibacter sp. HTCC2649]EAP99509.1 hypothetical protein JNB_05035 [Janibacter sp. HTCC2649]
MTTTPHPEVPQGPESQQPRVEQPQPSYGEQPPPPPPQQPYEPTFQQPQQSAYQQPASGQAYPGQPVTYAQQQVLDPAQQRQWGMFVHLIPLIAMVLSAGLLGFVGSLVIYVMYKERGDFVRQHAANSLNIQIITGIVLLVSFPLMLILVGFGTYFLALAFAFVLHIIGALRANEGKQWTPPFTPQFVK